MTPSDLPFETLEGLVVASGPPRAVCDAKLLNSIRAYVQQFARTADVAPFVPSRATNTEEAMLLVSCDGGLARRVSVWAVACDYLRGHAQEWNLAVHDSECRRLRDELPATTSG